MAFTTTLRTLSVLTIAYGALLAACGAEPKNLGKVALDSAVDAASSVEQDAAQPDFDSGEAEVTDAGDAEVTDAGDAEVTDAGDAEVTDAGDAASAPDGSVLGEPCSVAGISQCVGVSYFLICLHGTWAVYSCGPNLVCNPGVSMVVTCVPPGVLPPPPPPPPGAPPISDPPDAGSSLEPPT